MKRLFRVGIGLLTAMLLATACLVFLRQESARAAPMTSTVYVVDATEDAADADPLDDSCDSDLVATGTQCTLRAAIQEANRHPGRDSIVLTEGLTYTLSLTPTETDLPQNGDLDISDDVIISATGATGAIIDAHQIDRALHIIEGRTEISGLVICNGNVLGAGGGILNERTLIITNSRVISNSGSTGGGIYNFNGKLVLSNTALSGNFVSAVGGGLYNDDEGEVDMQGGEITSNSIQAASGYGAGLANIGSAQVSGVSISGNVISSTDAATGAGIANFNRAQLTLTLATLQRNVITGSLANGAGGGLYNEQDSSAYVVSSTIRQNSASYGGGVLNDGKLTIVASSLYSNAAIQLGGAIANLGPDDMQANLTLINSTVSGNTSNANAGGIHNNGQLSMSNVTLVHNSADADGDGEGDGGGLDNGARADDDGWSRSTNSIIALNVDGSPNGHNHIPDCSGILNVLGANLVQDTTACLLTGTQASVLSNTNPLLAVLADNDGPTWSHRPMFGSAVIDAGAPDGCVDPGGQMLTSDQRGKARPQDGRCDLGAVESRNPVAAFVYLPLAQTKRSIGGH